MKHFLNLRLHPAIILSSVAFWFIVYLLIYAVIMVYWIKRMFLTAGTNVTPSEYVGTPLVIYANQRIYRCKIKKYTAKISPR